MKSDYLKVKDLKPGYLYRIDARNGTVGVWSPVKGEFLLSRYKFGLKYVFGEVHYDLSDDFGTAKPLEELEKSPFEEHELAAGEWMNGNGETCWGYVKEEALLEYLNEWEHKLNAPHPKERPPR